MECGGAGGDGIVGGGAGGAGGVGGDGGAPGAVASAQNDAKCAWMSCRLLPRYEYLDAGDDAIASSVLRFAPPKPTANSLMPAAFTVVAVAIAALSPPYCDDCCPSVSSSTAHRSPVHGRPPPWISPEPRSSADEMSVQPRALLSPLTADPTALASADIPIKVRADELNSTTPTRVRLCESTN